VALLSQDGYPSPGVLRVRDVKTSAEQWRIGGAVPGANAPRILDLAWNGTPSQSEILSRFRPLDAAELATATPDDYAQVPMILAE